MIKQHCKDGQHPLVVVSSVAQNQFEDVVTRWCPDCGSVVVDVDVDGRTNPGYVMKMRSPMSILEVPNG